MANWFHRFFNPHCPHCAEELVQEMICESCETLKIENARLQRDNDRLLERILEKPETPKEREIAPVPQSVLPKTLPWAVRRQMLEAEDREKARLMTKAAKPDVTTTEEMEKVMHEVEVEREAKKS
jgi:hypothetical protein